MARGLDVLLGAFGRAFANTFPDYFAPRKRADAADADADANTAQHAAAQHAAAHDATSAAMLALLLVRAPRLTLLEFTVEAASLRVRGPGLPREWLGRLHAVAVRRPVQLDGATGGGAADAAAPVGREHAGWLRKEPRSNRSHGWHRRWCVLSSGEMRLYRSTRDAEPVEAVQLALMLVRVGAESNFRKLKDVRAQPVSSGANPL